MSNISGTTVVIGCVLALILMALITWGEMVLWNWLVPTLFHGPRITYWQAFGLSMLLGIVGSAFRGSKK